MTDFHATYGRYMNALGLLGHDAARRLWNASNVNDWENQIATLMPTLSSLQVLAGAAGGNSIPFRLSQQGNPMAGDWSVNPFAMGGWSSHGEPLEVLLNIPAIVARNYAARGGTMEQAWRRGGFSLDRIVSTQIMEAGRIAQAIEVSARPGLGFMRMVQPGACAMCILLAGRIFYGDHHATAFLIHENCRCFMEPVVATTSARSHYLDAQRDAFNSLSTEDQDRHFGRAAAEAIRAGADMGQVVNARLNGARSGMMWGHARAVMGPDAVRRATVNELFNASGGNRDLFRQGLQANGFLRNPDGTLSTGTVHASAEARAAMTGNQQRWVRPVAADFDLMATLRAAALRTARQ
jgi:hypothetical protein